MSSGKNKSKIGKIAIISLVFVSSLYFFQKNYITRCAIKKTKSNNLMEVLKNDNNVKIKSGNLSTDYNISKVLEDVDKFELNTVNVPVVVDIDSLSSNSMKVNEKSKKKAIDLIEKLCKKNINIILEPYPWIKNGELYETDWKPTDINKFFFNWKNSVLKVLIDDVAVPCKVDALNVASNFVYMEYAEDYWCDTIDFVRKNYKGLVTYRTCWWYTASWDKKTQRDYEKKLNNKLFSKVDFISIAAYFELTDKSENSTKDLIKCLGKTKRYNRQQNVKKEIYNFNKKWKKPIFFGELGFPKRNGAAVEPWNPIPSSVINNKEQARCFEAYRKVFEKEKWFMGFSIFAIGEDGDDKNYYPSKETEEIIKAWYKN